MTSGEIFITSLAEKGLISLISKGLTKWEENKQHYTTGQELYTHNHRKRNTNSILKIEKDAQTCS